MASPHPFPWPQRFTVMALTFAWGLSLPVLAQTKSAVQWYNDGVDKLAAQNFSGAIADFTESIKLNDQDADAYYNRGYAKHVLGQYQAAITDYNQAISLKS